ncbi:hypothetical protein [Bailinhaonella thermotolerans]|uniref:Uncharacterized protein n=1 Tax=Bailinhaonella thermotolerans TaxID=1070861 RepID=A0A3A4A029_9ACTN|nr:hypothetical protein [Bailinhaonella thermotolerans]RJL19411.1 hypothetical protein D5H75_40435 [Bailinhaonella thermotolerans]
MVYAGWWEYAGVEICNTARAHAYAGAACASLRIGAGGCPDLDAVTGPQAYTTPQLDAAPWYDPAIPESARVLGVVGLDLSGLSKAPRAREVSALAAGGGRLGTLAMTQRQMLATVLVLAADHAALSYGVAWLSRALADPVCAPGGCAGASMRVAAYCPGAALPRPGDDGPVRTLYDVGVIDGPTVVSEITLRGAVAAKVEVSLVAGRPWLYRAPRLVGTVQLGTAPTATFNPSATATCAGAATCVDDPVCTPPLPAPGPATLSDPCWTGTAFNARRGVLSVTPEGMPSWLETVPIIRVTTGAAAMRKLWVRLFQPKLGGCADPVDMCAWCGELSVMYLGAGTVLDVDGRTRTADAMCGGDITAIADVNLYGAGGGPMQWPSWSCDTGACIEVAADAAAVAADASVTVWLASREDAV